MTYSKVPNARVRPTRVSPLVYVSFGCWAVLAGCLAAQTKPQPGKTDPVSPGRLTLFPDDELFSFSPDGPNGSIYTRIFQTDTDANLSLKNASVLFGSNDTDPIVAASGRVIQPDRDTLVTASRISGTSLLNVQTYYPQQNNGFTVSNTLADRRNGIDVIAVATGDLDKALDSQDNYHDEVAVAYMTNAGTINLTVLNYANGASNVALASLTLPVPGSNVIASDNPLAVAIGDFDNKGNNEIALACVGSNGVTVTTYLYTTDGNGGGALQQSSSTLLLRPLSFSAAIGHASAVISYPVPIATVSLQAADFQGVGFDELAVGYAVGGTGRSIEGSLGASEPIFSVLKFDANLQATLTGTSDQTPVVQANVPPRVRVELASGQFLFNKSNPAQYPFGQHQLAIAWNNSSNFTGVEPANAIDFQAYYLSSDLNITPIGNLSAVRTDPTQQFSFVAGGFMGNGNINSPTASLALSAWTSNGSQGTYWIQTLAVSSGRITLKDSLSFPTGPVDSIQRLPLVAGDWNGNSVYLGAPVDITISNASRTNYILEEPPSHAYWDDSPQDQGGKQVQTVSRYTTFNTSYSNESTSTTSNKSTDHSTWTIGGSAQVSAGASVKAGANFGIASGELDASVDVTGKVAYDYNQNKDNYTGNSEVRDLKITATTDLDDYLNYRSQLFDIWRYRAYGVAQKDPNSNSFYEIILPGPSLTTSVGGLDADWYQPIHENGNILSYPSALGPDPSNPYVPSDLGPFTIGNSAPVSEPLVPASEVVFDGVSQTSTLRYSSTVSSGNSFDYSNTLAESLDVKASASASADIGGVEDKATVSGDVEFHNTNSWGNAQTSDNSLTTDTSMSVNLSSGDPNQSYSFFPVLYAATDGTMKMSFAVPNPATTGGSQENWAKLYGQWADPALNLPRRFKPTYSKNGTQNGWSPETGTIRKKMRGLFFRRAAINPTDNDYDYLNANATTGDVVRVEARVYNYSTAQMSPGIPVLFKAIPYDSSTDSEICDAPINGSPGDTAGLICPDSARTPIGSTTTAALNPLQFTCLAGTDDTPNATGCAASTFINWDTTSLGPSSGTNTYRVYVVLNPTTAEKYGPDGIPLPITSITNATPMVVTTGSPHGLENGDYVTIGQVKGLTDANATWQVTVLTPTSFQLNGTVPEQTDYAGGGTATLLNPGQNNEGYGTFSIAAKASGGLLGSSKPTDDYLMSNSVQALGLKGRQLVAGSVNAIQFRPLQVRVAVYSSDTHPLGARLRLFDGNPAQGAPVISDRLVHPGNNGANGTSMWISWTPKTAGVHQLYAQLLEPANDLQKGNNIASLKVDVFRVGDVNRDGRINRADLNEVMQNVGKWAATSSCGPACDLNGDGVISVLDVRKLVLICGAAVCGAQ